MASSVREQFDDYGNVVSVKDLTFTETILGEGSYGTVRLAKKKIKKKRNTIHHSLHTPMKTIKKFRSTITTMKSSFYSDTLEDIKKKSKAKKNSDEETLLVAVKIYNKSTLHATRDITKSLSAKRRISLHTAYEKVQMEIEIMKMMNHPNLLKLHEVIDSIQNDTLYIVLEYLPLGEIMTFDPDTSRYNCQIKDCAVVPGVTKDGFFTEEAAALYIVDILHGLAYLHKQHICHRDLKPENILIDKKGHAKISDFGVSYYFKDECDFHSLSRANLFGKLTKREGTYGFWSPEMCNGDSKTFSGYSSDLWACGVCLYVFVSGKLPFFSDNLSEIFDIICESPLSFNDCNFSFKLQSLISHLLKKNPENRATIPESLAHPFCTVAREQRINLLGLEKERKTLNAGRLDRSLPSKDAKKKSLLSKPPETCIVQ